MKEPEGAQAAKPVTEIRIGVSSCLLGQEVRYDGGHKKDQFVTSLLGRFVSFVPVCPEVELGLGIPRETIRLERGEGGIRLVAPRSRIDHTEPMRAWSLSRLEELVSLDLSGYILKKDSPSCGMERVRVHGEGGVTRDGRGLFAEALLARFPGLPVEEEGRLNDPRLRENFIERVFAWRRLADFFAGSWTRGGLVRFHTREKMLLLAHEPRAYEELGRLVAGAKDMARERLSSRYRELYMAGLARLATRGRHANVLHHMAGFLKRLLSPEDRAELAALISEYRKGLVPLVVPITLLRHHVRVHRVEYLEGQAYLEPHPRELMLRNHV